MANPLLENWTTPFELPPFDRITDADFREAFEVGLRAREERIARIINDPAPATFANTIEALGEAGAEADRVAAVFYNLVGADSTPAREEIQREMAPILARQWAEISSNSDLFARIDALWQERDHLDLTEEQAEILRLTHRQFLRNGAGLDAAHKARMKEIKERLSVIGTAFAQNLLEDERAWSMPLSEADLEGLPAFLVDAARAAGAEKGHDGPAVTLSRSIIVPFLQSSPRRDLRETAFAAWAARGANGGDTDTREIARETIALRAEMGAMLGYEDFASYRLEEEMAKTPENVRDLLMQVWAPARAAAEKDAEILQRMMRDDGVNAPLAPWDWRFYAERRRKAEFDLDEGALKPYFALDAMIEAAFDCATRLFGLEFMPLDVPLYHADVRAWEVRRNGAHVAVFIGDYLARSSKRSGAWCSAMRSQAKCPKVTTPIVINVCNFAKGDPTLLSFDDARTLFHEFGHALHQMLSDVTYDVVSGTSVPRDFVELPSQLFEHWLVQPEVLQKFARHVETDAAMPEALQARLMAAQTYDMGFQTVEYLASAIVDLDLHSQPAGDPMAMQAASLARIGMPDAITMRHATPHFAHVFSGGGYASAYYSYMWSEVMDADAFAAFEEAGDAFDPELAAALEREILARGGSRDAEESYRAFRGRLPSVAPLLAGRGLG